MDASELGIYVGRMTCALLAGGVLGWERELHDKPAGLRTNMLVSLGAALLVLIGEQLSQTDPHGHSHRSDLARIIQGIVGGIGFLGAGTIVQSRNNVRGLTTASALWLSAGLGIASGLGHYGLVLISVILGVIVLGALGALESRIAQSRVDDQTTR